MREQDLNKIIPMLAESLKKPLPEDFIKAWVQSGSPTSGITAYDLEQGAKLLFPVLTPLRNTIPRVGGGVGTATNWRAVTGINTGLMEIGVSEGNRSGVIAHTTKDFTAAYKGLGLEDNVTFESDYAGRTFDDVKALAVAALLESVMVGEEIQILGGNTSLALGTTPTPTTATATTGGTLAAQTWSVICVALTQAGYYATGGNVVGTAPVRGAVTRTNADSTSDTYGGGSAQKSAAASQVTTGATSTISATVANVSGAVAYAWFWGTAGSEKLGAITTINSVLITAAAVGTQLASSLPTSDNSTNALAFDGLLTQIFGAGSNAYVNVMAAGTAGTGTPLTSSSDGGIVEFDAALKSFWDNYRLSPAEIWVSSQEQQNITKKIMAAPSTAAQRFVFNVEQGKLMGGSLMVSYLNRFGMMGGGEYGAANELPIMLHPNLAPGTVMFRTKRLPYKLNNITNLLQVKTRREYYQLEWPLRTRKYEYGVYADEVLQNYFPPAFGVITNIGNG